MMTRNQAVVAAHRQGMIDVLAALGMSIDAIEIPKIRSIVATEEEALQMQKKSHVEVGKAGGIAALVGLNRRIKLLRDNLEKGNDDPVITAAVVAEFGE